MPLKNKILLAAAAIAAFLILSYGIGWLLHTDNNGSATGESTMVQEADETIVEDSTDVRAYNAYKDNEVGSVIISSNEDKSLQVYETPAETAPVVELAEDYAVAILDIDSIGKMPNGWTKVYISPTLNDSAESDSDSWVKTEEVEPISIDHFFKVDRKKQRVTQHHFGAMEYLDQKDLPLVDYDADTSIALEAGMYYITEEVTIDGDATTIGLSNRPDAPAYSLTLRNDSASFTEKHSEFFGDEKPESFDVHPYLAIGTPVIVS